MYCTNCGTEINETNKYCPQCGTAIQHTNTEDVVCDSTNAELPDVTRFDRFMKKRIFSKVDLTPELAYKSGKATAIMLLILHIITCLLVLFFDTDFHIGYGSFFVMLMDWYCLSKQGIRGKWKLWGLFVLPVYFWFRAIKSDKKYALPIIDTLWLILYFAILYFAILFAPFFAESIPENNTNYYGSSEVESTNNITENDTYSDEEILLALEIVENYLENEFVGDLVGISLKYADVTVLSNSKDSVTICFYVTKYNKFTDSYDEPYYVELTATDKQIEFGYNFKSAYEYFSELGYPLEYTVIASWDGEYSVIK